jgi:hypothetical protein
LYNILYGDIEAEHRIVSADVSSVSASCAPSPSPENDDPSQIDVTHRRPGKVNRPAEEIFSSDDENPPSDDDSEPNEEENEDENWPISVPQKRKSNQRGGPVGKGRFKAKGGLLGSMKKHNLRDIADQGQGGRILFVFEKISQSKMGAAKQRADSDL